MAERYDRSRPSYPEDLIDGILGSSPTALSVLDVACGTGIASRQMTQKGARVLGVDLNARMAEIAERNGIPTEVSAFETWDPRGRTFDVVTCAQAWHWLDPGPSSVKASAVMRPGGRLCLFWNVGHHPDDLVDALESAYRRALPENSPHFIGYAANRASDPVADLTNHVSTFLLASGHFSNPMTKSFPWSRTYTSEEWIEELHTHSDHAALAPGLQTNLFAEITRVIEAYGGAFRMPYVTILISAAAAGHP
ncbi:MAG: class I SAM-dependent methyltransferase [Nitrososphaerales archaeon]